MSITNLKPIFKWARGFMILLLIGLLSPTSTAVAQNPTGANLLRDPSFENSFRSNTHWQQFSTNGVAVCSTAACEDNSTARPRTGSHWVWFGGYDFTERGVVSPEIAYVYQNVTFPSARCDATLRFYLWIGEARSGSDANDRFRALVDGRVVFSANATQRSSYNSYRLVTVDVSSYANGGVHKVEFDTRVSQQLVTFNLDDVSLTAQNCTRAVKGDYSGDGKKDVAVYRPSNGIWYTSVGNFTFGETGDIPVPGDYNLDGIADVAVYRPSNGFWYLSSIGNFKFGETGDVPVTGDYNGDGRDDVAVFRPSNNTWYLSTVGNIQFGESGDVLVPGDYNGDGRDDVAVYRPSNGIWYISSVGNIQFGVSGDVPVPGDYNGDGRDDVAVYRPSNGTWYISSVGNIQYGQSGDIPVPGDYNGDGRDDVAVYRPSNGTWYISTRGDFRFGEPGDIPV